MIRKKRMRPIYWNGTWYESYIIRSIMKLIFKIFVEQYTSST
jgi:hypothetical protein